MTSVKQAQERVLFKGGHVLTMDAALGDVATGDVLVDQGRIVQVGRDLGSEEAKVIDATGMVVMPGFVEVHWHMWNSLWRGLSHEATGYMALHRLATYYTPEDHYAAVMYAATEALNAGITTCHDWANALTSEADALAHCQALADSGIRARFGYGRLPTPDSPPLSRADLEAVQSWMDRRGQGRLDLGIVIHKVENLRAEVAVAREMGLKTIAPHVNLAEALDLLGPDFVFTHGPGTPDLFLSLLAQKKVKVGLCPATDPLIGAGLPPLARFMGNGVPFHDIGFSVDVTCQTCADPFAAMRTIQHAARIHQQSGKTFEQIIFAPPDPEDPTQGLTMPRDMLELATLNGARVLGLEQEIGSLTPGKRADLILVRTSDTNMLPLPEADPSFQLVQLGQPANVDTVMVDGVLVKHHGRLLHVDAAAVGRKAADTMAALRRRAAASPLGAAVAPHPRQHGDNA
jgi:5-methylthioadenosine/S-adenosylhomocysteine deaminase